MSRQESGERFPDDGACARHLARLRWGGGFACPACGCTKGREPRAGAASRVRGVRTPGPGDGGHGDAPQPPAAQDPGPRRASRRHAFQRHLRAAAPGAAWHRQLQDGLAAAAQAAPGHGRPRPEPGSQGIAEVDGTSVPCRDGGVEAGDGAETDGAKRVAGRGRGAGGRILLAGAVELSEDGAPRRIRLEAVESHASEALRGFIAASVAPGARVITDGWSGYSGLPGNPRERRVVGGRRAHGVLAWVHRVFPNPRRWAMGVYHGLRRRHVQRYLDGSVFRWNRRRHRRTSPGSLPGIGLGLPPATCRDFTGGHA